MEEEKPNNQTKGTTLGPALSRGVGRTREKKDAGTKLLSLITQETFQTLTLKFRNTLSNPRRKMKTSRRRKHQEQPKQKTQTPKRRNYQK